MSQSNLSSPSKNNLEAVFDNSICLLCDENHFEPLYQKNSFNQIFYNEEASFKYFKLLVVLLG